MCFSTDWFEENHRRHIKTAKSCFVAERRKTAGLQSRWPSPSSVTIYYHRESNSLFHCYCSHLPIYFEILFKKCILDTCFTASFTISNSKQLKSWVRQVEIQYVQLPFPCLTQPYSPMARNHMEIKLAVISILYDPSEACYHHGTAGTICG